VTCNANRITQAAKRDASEDGLQDVLQCQVVGKHSLYVFFVIPTLRKHGQT